MSGASSTTNPADVTNRLQTYLSKKLLEHAVQQLRLSEFAQQGDLPKNMGTKTIRFFRKREAKRDDIVELTEGVAPTTYTTVDMEYVDATLVQIGEVAKITDVLSMIDIFNMASEITATMGEDAALDADSRIRDAIITGYQDVDNATERFSGVTNTGDSSADFATFDALSATNGKITRKQALGCITQLKVNRAPRINGGYVGVICPQVAHDMMRDSDWVEAAKYSNVQALYKGELGMLDGIRYVEATNPFIEDATYGTYNAAGDNFSTFFLGRGCFGTPKLAGTKSPWKPRVNVVRGPSKSDPLDQYALLGWKVFWTAKVLNTNFGIVLRSKSTF